MKLATTTADFDNYTHSHCDSFRYISRAGFKYVDLSFTKNNSFKERIFTDGWKSEVEKIKTCANELGITLVQSHVLEQQNLFSPEVNPEVVKSDIIRCIEVCKELGIPSMVMHSQRSDEFGFERDKWLEANKKVILMLAPYFEDAGVSILLENGPLKHALARKSDGTPFDPPKYYCASVSGETLRQFVDYVDHPMVHACWDTGHANMNGAQYTDILTLKDELRGLHVHDNSGNRDEHTLPFFGSMNFDELMHALLDCKYNGFFTFEATEISLTQEDMRRQFPQDKRLFNTSAELRLCAEKYLYDVGRHILTCYGCFEE